MRASASRTPMIVTTVLVLSTVLLFSAAASPVAERKHNKNKDVIVHLFNWPWESVGRECREFLGPKGFGAVQLSPAQEHVIFKNDKVEFPWWQDYQPVSYKLESRRGGRAALKKAIQECHEAGVKVYADALVNHMAAMSGVGSAGTKFGNYSLPGTWEYPDFHHTKGCENGIDYKIQWQVQLCELSGLNDLDTGNPSVQRGIQKYLKDLLSIGVDGFRIDAAKHVEAKELAQILKPVKGYKYLEVIGTAGEPEGVQPTSYLPVGANKITEFRLGQNVSDVIRSGDLVKLLDISKYQQLKRNVALTFIDNHDTQRGSAGSDRNPLKYKDGALYGQAEAFLLAYGYGQPILMSSYTFDGHDQGPPALADGTTKLVECGNGWECEHRWRAISNLVALHNVAGKAPVTHKWTNGKEQIAFGRGKRAFVGFACNSTVTRTFKTGLPKGEYCDVANGDFVKSKCTGPVYKVNEKRELVDATIPKDGVLAIHVKGALDQDQDQDQDQIQDQKQGDEYEQGEPIYGQELAKTSAAKPTGEGESPYKQEGPAAKEKDAAEPRELVYGKVPAAGGKKKCHQTKKVGSF